MLVVLVAQVIQEQRPTQVIQAVVVLVVQEELLESREQVTQDNQVWVVQVAQPEQQVLVELEVRDYQAIRAVVVLVALRA